MPSAVNTYGKINIDGDIQGSRLTTDGLILNLDAGNPKSYPGPPSGNVKRIGPDFSDIWYDTSSKGNHFFLVNAPSHIANPGFFTFNGTNQYAIDSTAYYYNPTLKDNIFNTYINMDPSPVAGFPTYGLYTAPTTDRTIEIWFKLNNTLNQYAGLFARDINASGCVFYPGTLGDLGKFCWTWDDSLQSGAALTNKAVQLGEWIQLVVVLRNSYYYTYYVNGQLDKAEQRTTDLGSPPNYWWTIARENRFLYYLACSVSILRMYNRILTAQEILNNYNTNKGRFGLK